MDIKTEYNKLSKKFLNKGKSTGKKPDRSRGARTILYWKIILIGFTVFNIIVLSLSFMLFLRISGDSLSVGVDIEQPGVESLNKDELDSALHLFEEKSEEFVFLKSNPPTIIDLP